MADSEKFLILNKLTILENQVWIGNPIKENAFVTSMLPQKRIQIFIWPIFFGTRTWSKIVGHSNYKSFVKRSKV